MTEPRPKVTREGIHIEREVADDVAIEVELDSNVLGPYRFPDPLRRRPPALIYLAMAVLVVWLIDPLPALIPLAVGAWHWLGSWPLAIEQEEALAKAAGAVEFPVGHASAAMTFHGLRARPRWSVILYSAAGPPDQRALVVVDAVDNSQVGETYVDKISPDR